MKRIRLTWEKVLVHLLMLFMLATSLPLDGFAAQAQAQAPQTFGLKVKTDDGSGASTTVKSISTVPPVVVVLDANDRPVQGALVVFTTPDSGSSGVFEDGTRTMTAATDRDGRAAALGFRANAVAGTYPVQVHVEFLNDTVDAEVTHTNVAAAKSSKKMILILAIAGGGAAGALLAAKGGGGGGTTTTTTPTLPTITFGGSTVGAPGQ